MKAMIKIEKGKQVISFNIDNIINVVYTNNCITLVQTGGISTSYDSKNIDGYNYIISII